MIGIFKIKSLLSTLSRDYVIILIDVTFSPFL